MSEFCLTPSQTAELAFESRNKMRKNPNNLRRRLLLKQNYKSNYTRSLISLMAYRNRESDSEFHQEGRTISYCSLEIRIQTNFKSLRFSICIVNKNIIINIKIFYFLKINFLNFIYQINKCQTLKFYYFCPIRFMIHLYFLKL